MRTELCINSVPHLEALLLLRSDSQQEWDAQGIAQRLYIRQDFAIEVLSDLFETGFLSALKSRAHFISLQSKFTGYEQDGGSVGVIYIEHLIGVTVLIHARGKLKAQRLPMSSG